MITQLHTKKKLKCTKSGTHKNNLQIYNFSVYLANNGIYKKKKKMFSSKTVESFITVVVMSSRGLDLFKLKKS